MQEKSQQRPFLFPGGRVKEWEFGDWWFSVFTDHDRWHMDFQFSACPRHRWLFVTVKIAGVGMNLGHARRVER
jgi:hypothetical protein